MKVKMLNRARGIRNTPGDTAFEFVNAFFLLVMAACTIFPFLYIVSVSLTPLEVLAQAGSFQLIPQRISFDAFRFIIGQNLIPRAFLNSVIITVTGTILSLAGTSLLAYGLSLAGLPGRKFWLLFVLVPMVFSGGIIPLFLLVKSLGLMDTLWSVVLPGAISTYNLLIMKNFFETLPAELSESAHIDGAGHFTVFTRIILPLSSAVMATIGLFYAVGLWNGFFNALMFINTESRKPLQVILRDVLMDSLKTETQTILDKFELLPGMTLKMAAVVISVLPLLVIYPMVQKYFTKGVLIGSVKG